jgi:eukaryotic-like serine/threonine-protein kinase
MAANDGTMFKPGTMIDDKWIIIETIGKGAMGEVYRAHQINLKRDVAIKTISEEMLQELEDDPEELEMALKRFQREVQTMAQVRHQNILNIFDYGVQKDGKSDPPDQTRAIEYIVMEYIPGDSLRFTMSDDGLDDDPDLYASWIKSYFLTILDGVEAMHHHNIFHRDLKPENIFMDGEIPKIADFGLARSYRMKAVSNSMDTKGTLTYMAPEQFTDFRKADQTADIYALGKLLFEAVDGKLDQKTLPMKTVSLENYKNIDIPFLKGMNKIIQKATAENKIFRFQTVSELRTALLKTLALNKAPSTDQTTIQAKAVEFVQAQGKWIWIMLILTLVSIGGMAVWHITDKPENIIPLQPSEIKADVHGTEITFPQNLKDLKEFLIGSDGSRMILTGNIEERSEKGESSFLKTPLLYIDENKISNYLFVDFLNANKDYLVVENGIIKHNDIVIFYLGSSTSEEGQIIYQHERFHLKNQDQAGNPVTRVSYHGAMEYAKYYGRTLLTESEWRFSYGFHLEKVRKNQPLEDKKEPEPSMSMMHGTSHDKPELKEIRILDGMGLKIKEWIRIEKTDKSNQSEDINLISGFIGSNQMKVDSEPSLRQQWEGLSDVGFRTKIRIR